MKRDRSLNDDQRELSLKRIHLQNENLSKNIKQEQVRLSVDSNYTNRIDKKHIFEKVQLWLDHMANANEQITTY